MIKEEQEKWLQHLDNERKIEIVPFDPTAEEKFQKIKDIVQAKLGRDAKVEHHGSTSLGISGQDEIDIYVPVPAADFNRLIAPMSELFGEPRSHYDMERVRFRAAVDGKKIDMFLANEEHSNWINSIRFEEYLREHPEALQAYKELKEENAGSTTQDYYRKKIEFINDILSKG